MTHNPIVSCRIVLLLPTGEHSQGLYWIDDTTSTGKRAQLKRGSLRAYFGSSDESESLLRVMKPGDHQSESVRLDASFVIRSSDLRNRFRIKFGNNPGFKDDPERPYSIQIVNLASADREETHPLELKHSNSGYEWVDPSEYSLHYTDINHYFTVRDSANLPLLDIVIHGPQYDDETLQDLTRPDPKVEDGLGPLGQKYMSEQRTRNIRPVSNNFLGQL